MRHPRLPARPTEATQRTSVELPHTLHSALAALSHREGVSLQAIMRRAIAREIALAAGCETGVTS